jgi:hypothetical protein
LFHSFLLCLGLFAKFPGSPLLVGLTGVPLHDELLVLTVAAFASIIAALLITMIAISIQRPGDGKVDATTTVSVAKGFMAVTNIVFAYGKSSAVNLHCVVTNCFQLAMSHFSVSFPR